MTLEEILKRRVIVLSGKGGVGKSVLTATLALIASRTGKRVLIVELDTIETVPHFFGVSHVQPYTEVALHEHISSLHIDGKSALEEYLRMVLKSKKIAERVFRSPVYKYFVEVAPGLKELMTIGKIWDLEQSRVPRTDTPKYDLLVVDTPATGHTSSYFRMPQAAVKTIKRGFVRKEAQKVADLLQDSDKILFNIVTTLEELPVNETMDLYGILVHQLQLPVGCIFANKMFPSFPEGEDLTQYLEWKGSVLEGSPNHGEVALTHETEYSVLSCAESWRKRRNNHELYADKLRKTLPCDIYPVPLLFSPDVNLTFIEGLAQAMTSGPRVLDHMHACFT